MHNSGFVQKGSMHSGMPLGVGHTHFFDPLYSTCWPNIYISVISVMVSKTQDSYASAQTFA